MDLDQITGTSVPTWVMVLIVSVLTLSLLVGVPLARAAGKRRGHRLAHPEAFVSRREKVKDTALFLAALIPSLLVWLSVMGVSFIGLTGFARDVMGWDHWTNMLVPLSLDGISVSFGAWAFVAVKRGRHPGRAYKIVLAAATMSAALNFVHGRDKWSIWAGLYLAFLSMAGMAMFHELLDQFMASIDDDVALKTRYPRFGQRWLYAPLSTFSARRAWIVHPPAEGVRPSVRNALDHLVDVRDAKRQRRLDGALRVREEQQAKLVEVHARAEVRRAKANSGRRPEPSQQHRPLFVPPQQPGPHYGNGNGLGNGHGNGLGNGIGNGHGDLHGSGSGSSHGNGSSHGSSHSNSSHGSSSGSGSSHGNGNANGNGSNGRLPAVQQPHVLEPVLQQRVMQQPPPVQEPEPMRLPEPILDPVQRAELESIFPVSSGREPMGRHPLWDQHKDVTQRMIAEALAMGETPLPGEVRDWAQREFGFRPSDSWARDQIRSARSRDIVGMDADLV